MARPYLSIIMPSRNDDHGGSMLSRMKTSLAGLFHQLEKHGIESELLFVEWNPPDAPLLKDILPWPKKLKYCTIRVIVVPQEIHNRFQGAGVIPMHVVAAINCGLRRARGLFLLPAMLDLLYSDELMAFIGGKSLKEDERYRVDRYDVNRDVLTLVSFEAQLAYCHDHVIRKNEYQPGQNNREGMPSLHTNASGDFQLMSHTNWHRLHGYREEDIPAAYVDSLMAYASHAAGIKEVRLEPPIRLYHIDHDNKFTQRLQRTSLPYERLFSFLPEPIRNLKLSAYRRLLMLFGFRYQSSVMGVPTIDYADYWKLARDIVAGKHSYAVNDEHWGLADDHPEEHVINRAAWDTEPENTGDANRAKTVSSGVLPE